MPADRVDAELRPYLRPLGESDESFIRHNVQRSGPYSGERLAEAMYEQQLYRARAQHEGAPKVAAMHAAVTRLCPVCGERAVPLDPRQYRDPWTELCGGCRAEELRQVVAAHAERRLADGRTVAEAVRDYRAAKEAAA
jgi:hypothetical protein